MIRILALLVFLGVQIGCTSNREELFFADEFDDLRSGDLFSDVGAHSEYHFLKEAAPKGNWALTSFRNETQNSWSVQRDNGDRILYQKRKYQDELDYHPMLIAGDERWEDYTVEVKFAPLNHELQSGVVFRYRNDRCYYFFGVKDKKAVLKVVQHGSAWLVPDEKVLHEVDLTYETGTYLTASITIKGDDISASITVLHPCPSALGTG